MGDEQIWLVSVSEDDWQSTPVAAFDKDHQDGAESFAKRVGGEVEYPIPLNPSHDDHVFKVVLERGGDTRQIVELCFLTADQGLRRACYRVETDGQPIGIGLPPSRWSLDAWVYARDKEHAVKVANEIRIQILAGAKPTEGSIP